MALKHGGDRQSYFIKYGKEPLDFSANTNPLGVPLGVHKAIRDAASLCDRYPDLLCRELCDNLGKALNIPREWILCGNGSAEIIWRLAAAKKPNKVLLCAPTFSEYEAAVRCFGGCVVYHYLTPENDFKLDRSIFGSLSADIDMLFLCNPNNPTGITIEPELLREIAIHCHKNGTVMVVDECFNGFLDIPEKHTLLSSMEQNPQLVILRAFTKLYGMAGVRLGFCMSSNVELLKELMLSGQPWAVSTLAQSAGIAALREKSYLLESREVIQKQRAYLIEGLETLGLRVFHGEANYLLFYTDNVMLEQQLQKCGILIRDCSNYVGLNGGYFRIAVRNYDDNHFLLQAIASVVGGHI